MIRSESLPGLSDYYFWQLPVAAHPQTIVTKGWLEASFRQADWLGPLYPPPHLPVAPRRRPEQPGRRVRGGGIPNTWSAWYWRWSAMGGKPPPAATWPWLARSPRRTGISGSPSSWQSGIPAHSEERYLPYLLSRRQLYQAMIDDGLRTVVGLWHQDQLVASCGLFFTGTLGRFQLVRTHAECGETGGSVVCC